MNTALSILNHIRLPHIQCISVGAIVVGWVRRVIHPGFGLIASYLLGDEVAQVAGVQCLDGQKGQGDHQGLVHHQELVGFMAQHARMVPLRPREGPEEPGQPVGPWPDVETIQERVMEPALSPANYIG